jgi:hypothetical protein
LSDIDRALASERAGRLIEKINETLEPGWTDFLARKNNAQIAVLPGSQVALVCEPDGVFYQRPSDGELLFVYVKGGRWYEGSWASGVFTDHAMGPLADPSLQ